MKDLKLGGGGVSSGGEGEVTILAVLGPQLAAAYLRIAFIIAFGFRKRRVNAAFARVEDVALNKSELESFLEPRERR